MPRSYAPIERSRDERDLFLVVRPAGRTYLEV